MYLYIGFYCISLHAIMTRHTWKWYDSVVSNMGWQLLAYSADNKHKNTIFVLMLALTLLG